MPELSGIIQNYLEGSISTIGRTPVIESKSITENGTYTAPEGVDGYSPITVNVPIPTPVIQSKSITENGTYTAPEGVDGYSPITVNVPIPTPIIQSKSITENGTYTAPEGVDGYSPITVNVPIPTEGSKYKIYAESAMSIFPTLNGKFYSNWDDGGGNIGLTLNGVENLSDLSSIKCEATITDSYEYNYKTGYDRCQFVYGFTDIQFNDIILVGYNTGDHVIMSRKHILTNDQSKYINDTIDISNLSGDLYFFVSLLGITGNFEFIIE